MKGNNMASTKTQERISKRHYDKDRQYREKKNKQDAARHKANREEYNAYAREYYRNNKEYREYKKKYSRDYKRTHRKSR